MWRIGVVLVAAAFLDFSAADIKPTEDHLVQRLKRSPNYCDNYEYDSRPRPRFWPPPPPPPPFWPPRHHPPPYWPPPPPPDRFQEYTDAASNGRQPCSTCSGKNGESSAISDAKSETGDAIAVAVAKASPKS